MQEKKVDILFKIFTEDKYNFITSTHRLILLIISQYPEISYVDLSDYCGLNRRTVITLVKQLKKINWLRVSRATSHYHSPNRYEICIQK